MHCAYAEGTFANLNNQCVKFLEFCVKFGLVAVPASGATLAWYSQYLSKQLKSHGSLVGYMAGVKKLHEVMGVNTLSFSNLVLKLTLQGLKRINPHVVRRARPITPDLLQKIYTMLNMDNIIDAVF